MSEETILLGISIITSCVLIFVTNGHRESLPKTDSIFNLVLGLMVFATLSMGTTFTVLILVGVVSIKCTSMRKFFNYALLITIAKTVLAFAIGYANMTVDKDVEA